MTPTRLRAAAPTVATVVAALTLAGLAAPLALTAGRAEHPVVTVVVSLAAAGAFVGGGLVAHRRQPSNRIGRLMVLTGFVLLAGLLSESGEAWAFTVGLSVQPLSWALFAHLLLAFPGGRLRGGDRWLVAVGYVDALAVELLMMVVMAGVHEPTCPCPENLLYAIDAPRFHDAVMDGQRLLAVGLEAAIIVVLLTRWRAATPPTRRVLAPVLSTSAVAVVVTGASFLASPISDGAMTAWLTIAATASLALLPIGFLAGLLQARLARAAVGDLVIELGRGAFGSSGGVRDALARTLRDPSLTLAYYRRDSDTAVDLSGAPVPDDAPRPGRARTVIRRDGAPVAAVVHDASLTDDPGLVEAACAAAGLALENERLQAELRARLEDLRASRARIVAAGDTERRRLERNLHDGAQQRLVSVSMALALARSALATRPEEADGIVGSAQQELTDALAELRELARGIHPSILTNRGLGPALEALAARVPVPVSLDVSTGRLPDGVEAAAYYVVAEAVTNAVKYASADLVDVRVRLLDSAAGHRSVEVVVADDGVGGADPAAGTGLRGLADRVEALDGRFRVAGAPARGTVVSAVIPCA